MLTKEIGQLVFSADEIAFFVMNGVLSILALALKLVLTLFPSFFLKLLATGVL